MKRLTPKLVLSVLSLGLVLTLFLLDTRRTSPGELSPVHAQVAELAGNDGCDRCHGGFAKSMADSCTDCHAAIETAIESGRGLHGTLEAVDPRQCATCHVEHHGAQLELAGEHAFGLAGIAERERYDHAALGFQLEGRHAELTCVRCHAHADAPLLEPGKPRFPGLSQECSSCHADPHGGRMKRACGDCHGQAQPFSSVAEFEHGAVFTSRGAHARAACVDCHPAQGAHSVEELGGPHPPLAARACVDCHAPVHASKFIESFAASVSLAAGESCVACHDPAGGPFQKPQLPADPAWHAATGFALNAPHAAAACSDCHGADRATSVAVDARASFSARVPARTADDCGACHADPHAGQFADEPRAVQGCLGCHERSTFRPSKFDAELHASTKFPLQGAHLAAECAQCHPKDPAAPVLKFADADPACSSCHVDAHDGRFQRREIQAQDPSLESRGCAACHDTHDFASGARESFDHAAMAGFALDGAHAKAACEVCHSPSATPDAAGRTFGRAASQFPGPVGRCSTCHADVHAGSFDARGPESQRDASCARCHTTASFRQGAREKFDHAQWTSFELSGAHARTACEDCHPTLEQPTPQGRRVARASEKFSGPIERCETCHADPHRGRFTSATSAASGCAHCHTTSAFRDVDPAGFDHGLWTDFALAGAHAETMCVACHSPIADSQGHGFKRGPAAGTACADCHADPHAGQFESAGVNDCARCHDPRAAFAAPRFDHQQQTRFALDATHAKLACSACHVAHTAASGTRVVRYRPLGTRCADCHGGATRPPGSGGKR